jgi:hypothetical protein
MNMVCMFSVPGKGGGLALFWDKSFDVELNKFGEHFIDVSLVLKQNRLVQ